METAVICVSESDDEEEVHDAGPAVVESHTASTGWDERRTTSDKGEEESDGAGAASAADATTGASASTSSDFQGSNATDSVERVRARLRELDNELEDLEHTIAQLSARQSDLRAERARLGARLETEAAHAEAAAARRDWTDVSLFAWSSAVDAARERLIGRGSSFRHNQRAAINATLSGRDTFVIAPTGGGKSLCFLVPQAVEAEIAAAEGLPTPLTLVVSPLLALMHDQVGAAGGAAGVGGGARAAMLHAELERSEASAVLADVGSRDGTIGLLYVTPEKLVKSKTLLSKLEKANSHGRLRRVVIDEAHCCSEWGHDFRPDYLKLNLLKIQFSNVPLMCLTATATFRVQRDVKEGLGIPGCEVFRSPTFRSNLRYRVEPKGKDVMEQIALLVQTQHAQQSGIVYCLSKKDAESVAAALRANGVTAAAYTSDCTTAHRQSVQDAWGRGDVRVVVATTAFGLGVNKLDVRFVFHHSLSKSIESYYQESGRAGRDGKPADCVLFYSPTDFVRVANMVCYDHGGTAKLLPLAQYCESHGVCRKTLLAARFGETVHASDCAAMCDACAPALLGDGLEIVTEDAAKPARGVLEMVRCLQRIGERRTLAAAAELFRGAGRKHLDMEGVPKAPKSWSRDDCEHFLVQLVCESILGFEYVAFITPTAVMSMGVGMFV